MDKLQQRLDDSVKRLFGAYAAIDGSFGTTEQPGELRIMLDGTPIGAGRTFSEAVQTAAMGIAVQSRREKANEPTRGLTLGAAFDQPAAAVG